MTRKFRDVETDGLVVNGRAKVQNFLIVNGGGEFGGGLLIGQDLEVLGDMSVTGTFSLASDLQVPGALDVTGITTLDITNINGTLSVNAPSLLSGVSVSEALNVTGTSTLGDAWIGGTLDVVGGSNLGSVEIGVLQVNGLTRLLDQTQIIGTLNVTSTSTLGVVDILSTLDVAGTSTLGVVNINNTLTAPGSSILGSVSTTGTLSVGSTSTFYDDILVTGVAQINGRIISQGPIEISKLTAETSSLLFSDRTPGDQTEWKFEFTDTGEFYLKQYSTLTSSWTNRLLFYDDADNTTQIYGSTLMGEVVPQEITLAENRPISFRQGVTDVVRIEYDSPLNELLIKTYDSGVWTTLCGFKHVSNDLMVYGGLVLYENTFYMTQPTSGLSKQFEHGSGSRLILQSQAEDDAYGPFYETMIWRRFAGNSNVYIPDIATSAGALNPLDVSNTGLLCKITSSKRFKTNIVSAPAFDPAWLRTLELKSYTDIKDKTNHKCIGYIAEEVVDVFPYQDKSLIASYDDTGQVECLKTREFIYYLIEAYKDLYQKVEELGVLIPPKRRKRVN